MTLLFHNAQFHIFFMKLSLEETILCLVLMAIFVISYSGLKTLIQINKDNLLLQEQICSLTSELEDLQKQAYEKPNHTAYQYYKNSLHNKTEKIREQILSVKLMTRSLSAE